MDATESWLCILTVYKIAVLAIAMARWHPGHAVLLISCWIVLCWVLMDNEPVDLASIHLWLRITARASFLFFLPAFTGNSLQTLWPGPFTGWLRRNCNRSLIALAASHSVHLAFIVALVFAVGWPSFRQHFGLLTMIVGGFVFLLIYSLALSTVIQAPVIRSSKFQTFALYAIWTIFALGFIPRMISGGPIYGLLGAAALLAWLLRITAWMRTRKAQAANA